MADIDATEAAVELATEHKLDLAQVTGTGAGGRIVKGDVEAALKAAAEPVEAGEALTPQEPASTDPDELRQFTPDETLRSEAAEFPAADPLGPADGDLPVSESESERRERILASIPDEGPAWSDWATVDAFLGLAPETDPDDPTPIAIQAATTLQQLLTMDIDRPRYAAALHARAKSILEGKV